MVEFSQLTIFILNGVQTMGTENPLSDRPVSATGSEIERLFTAPGASMFRWAVPRHTHLWEPPTDMYETDTHIVVIVEISGVRHSDLKVALADRHLTISGVRHDTGEHRAYHQMEIHYGEFRTDLDLPMSVDAEGIEAMYRDGFLRVALPKAKPHRIEIGG